MMPPFFFRPRHNTRHGEQRYVIFHDADITYIARALPCLPSFDALPLFRCHAAARYFRLAIELMLSLSEAFAAAPLLMIFMPLYTMRRNATHCTTTGTARRRAATPLAPCYVAT